MTRRPLVIAAVVTVAALACVMPFWRDVWMAVAYRKTTYPPPEWNRSAYQEDVTAYLQLAPWLPGPDMLFPSQVCPHCADNRHDDCSVAWRVFPDPDTNGEYLVLKQELWGVRPLVIPPHIGPESYCTCHPEREKWGEGAGAGARGG